MSKTQRRVRADDVYACTKHAINELARSTSDMRKLRNPALEDCRDKNAFDALDDVQQLVAELSVLWDQLWAAIGKGRTDPIAWASREFESLEPTDDTWLVRHRTEQNRNAKRRERRQADREEAVAVEDVEDVAITLEVADGQADLFEGEAEVVEPVEIGGPGPVEGAVAAQPEAV